MTRNSRLSAERICSEADLSELALEWVGALRKGRVLPRILLTGEMGTGKSTFARAFLEALGVDRAAEGSPTFAIAHEYRTDEGLRVIHADGYRLKSESDLEETGLLESLWDPEILFLFEWMELFPATHASLVKSGLPVREVRLEFIPGEQGASARDPAKIRKVSWTQTN